MLAVLISPPGKGALAVLHVCGEGAKTLVARLFGRDPIPALRVGFLVDNGVRLDEVLVRMTDGFSGEETVEITCHGGAAVVERILDAMTKAGAVRADPEELLERGVETGALDRVRAEAWALLPRALTELAAAVLQDQAQGALTGAIAELSTPRDAERLLATAPLGTALAVPRRVVLAGSPNVGKSTLFNALVRDDRALVSPVAGTTRDPVREVIAVEQVPIELVDTAGIDAPRDLLEQLSLERTHRALKEADVVLFVFDAEAGAQGQELRFLEALGHRRTILLVNKIDAGSKKPLLEALPVSAKTGEGLDALRRRLLRSLGVLPRHAPGEPVVFTARQERILSRTASGALAPRAARDELF
ncbi:MAG TPA: GTPase [Planctomycetota bacterium]|jgi:tRNA modification GTPase|nr:GTPase [Planctomycetota bacterium]